MSRTLLYLILIVVALVVIQFIRPEKNLGELDTDTDFIQDSQVPDTLASIFLNSCYDCHSNNTRYPWYGSLAPLSWFLNGHVVEGKSHLNFSSWGILDKAQKISQLDQICEECNSGSMPLKSYLLIHRSSRLSNRDIVAICDWADSEALEILTQE